MFHRFGAVLTAFLIFATAQAGAKNFSSSDVENFIKVAQQLEGIDERYPDADLGLNIDGPEGFAEFLDEDGSFAVFSKGLAKMPAGPARQEVSSTIKSNGFASMDSFASIADDIMMAYVAIEMEGQDMSAMNQMTPAMLASMPPAVQEQMKTIKLLMSAVQKVPAEDVATLKPLKGKLDKAMQ